MTNPYFYKIEINYVCGHARISKIISHSVIRKYPKDLSGSSFNVIPYSDSKNLNQFNKNQQTMHLILIFGGLKEKVFSNELWAFNTESNQWQTIDLKIQSSIYARKGHTSVLVPSFGSEDMNLNKDLVRNFYTFIFGGKSESKYLNDLIVIKITYMTIDNTFYYKSINPEITGSVYPEPREGHHAFVKDDYMYIYGGCNKDLKMCYDDMYRLSFKTTPLKWEKLNIKLNAMEKFDQLNMNINEFLGNMISYGNVKEKSCEKKFNVFLENFDCNCEKAIISIDEAGNKIAKCVKENDIQPTVEVSTKTEEKKPLRGTVNLNTTSSNEPLVKKDIILVSNPIENNKTLVNTTETLSNNQTSSRNLSDTNYYAYHDVKNPNHRGRKKDRNKIRHPSGENKIIASGKIIEKEQLKIMINSIIETSIKPLLKENESIKKLMSSKMKQRKDSSELEEKIKSDTNDIKNLIEKTLNKNMRETKNLSRNFTNIKYYLEEYSKQTKDEFKLSIDNLLRGFEDFNKNTTEKLNKLERESSEITKELSHNIRNRPKCIFGMLVNETRCVCYPGYGGGNCDTPLKCEEDCNTRGICILGKCHCDAGFEGISCGIQKTCKNECNSNGQCIFGKCVCNDNYTGEDCSQQFTCLNNCNNKGICFRGNCLCEAGYYGNDCSKISFDFKQCGGNNCNGNGLCKYEKCFCYPGYSGSFCEVKHDFQCPPFRESYTINKNSKNNNSEEYQWLPCNGNGICKYGKCFCYPGFNGDDCSSLDKCPNECTGNGICDNGKCICNKGFTKFDCSEIKEDFYKLYKNMHFKETEIYDESDQLNLNLNNQKKGYSNYFYYVILILPILLLIAFTFIFSK